ncbi:MAG TPA: hybrid sensor histidine kinase/response regulator [Usitatibacter sp.]|nr:hybrid sensor histidine kinase/response regulator [Usitatibacter sp.]
MAREDFNPNDPVLAEILGAHFADYRRSLVASVPFGLMAMWLIWGTMPAGLVLGWFAAYLATSASRLALSYAYDAPIRNTADVRERMQFAIGGHALGGLAWGVVGTATLVLAPGHHENALAIFFIVVVFATYQAADHARYEPAYAAWMLFALVPNVFAAALQQDPIYHVLGGMGALFLLIVTVTGRRSNQLMKDSIAKRLENARLLTDMLVQKEALAEANLSKTRFLAAASHDLRQPMQAVVLLVESLQERVHEPGVRRIVESIRTSVIAMSALLNELLDISRFDAGTVKPQVSSFPVTQVLDRVRSSFAYSASQKNLSFRVRRSSAVIETDPILLYRILVNLLNNALRYTHKGGVLVGCRRRKEGLLIEVWDTGIGIPEEKFDDIFREFHQLANPQRDREQGLGLGLAIVERTGRLLGHPVRVQSRVGRGSVFSMVVPYGDPSQVRTSERARAADALEGLAVLIVEDENEIRGAMTVLLEGWGCRVAVAVNGVDVDRALAKAAIEPHAILADYRLPGNENGIAVIQRVRRRFPDAAGIVITGDIAPEVLTAAEAAQLHLMHKPLRPARLRSLLGAVWREHNAAGEPLRAAGE